MSIAAGFPLAIDSASPIRPAVFPGTRRLRSRTPKGLRLTDFAGSAKQGLGFPRDEAGVSGWVGKGWSVARWLRHSADFPELGPITPADTFVDIGCGLGGACVAAGEAGAEVIAVDVDADLIRHTSERMQGVAAKSFRGIVAEPNGRIPLPDGAASVVVCTEVIEHIPGPAGFVAELARIGRPGARYLISVPDPASEALMGLVATEEYFRFPGHINVFEHETLDALLRDAGLEVVARPWYPNNGYWSIHTLLRAAADDERCNPVGRYASPDAPKGPPEVAMDWNRVWRALEGAPGGDELLARLDHLLPRSQVVIARKPSAALNHRADRPHVFQGAKSFLKRGKAALGGFELSWTIRRRQG